MDQKQATEIIRNLYSGHIIDWIDENQMLELVRDHERIAPFYEARPCSAEVVQNMLKRRAPVGIVDNTLYVAGEVHWDGQRWIRHSPSYTGGYASMFV